MASSAPFTEDALNRFRITHPDRELRPLLRRIHRFPRSSEPEPEAVDVDVDPSEEGKDGNGDNGREIEKEMINLELIKWKIGIERVMGSVKNLERMKESYERRTNETVARTQLLRGTLEDEQEELRKRKLQRDYNIKCDQVAEKIKSRGKSRKELDEQISILETSLEEQRTSHSEYIQIVQNRLDLFGQITKLIEDCKSTKLPIDSTFTSTPPSSSNDEIPQEKIGMEIDLDLEPTLGSASGNGNGGKLNASAIPFQPTTTTTTISRPSTSSSLKVPASANHNLPSRPSSSSSRNSATATTSNAPSPLRSTSTSKSLPARPSALRSSTTPLVNYSSGSLTLEDGEVGEEGEVGERGNSKRGREGDISGSGNRSTRSRVG